MTYFNNNIEQPVRAAGVLIYKRVNGHLYFLMQLTEKTFKGVKRTVYEDFGGKIEAVDTDWRDIILREAVEESNGVLQHEELARRLNDDEICKPYYNARAKYAFCLIPATEEEKSLTGAEFGCEENCGKFSIQRQVRWVNANDVAFRWRTSLHIRLRVPGVLDRRGILCI